MVIVVTRLSVFCPVALKAMIPIVRAKPSVAVRLAFVAKVISLGPIGLISALSEGDGEKHPSVPGVAIMEQSKSAEAATPLT